MSNCFLSASIRPHLQLASVDGHIQNDIIATAAVAEAMRVRAPLKDEMATLWKLEAEMPP